MGGKNCKAVIALLLFALACKKPVSPSNPSFTDTSAHHRVYIVGEGRYTAINSTLGLYLPDKDSVYRDVFQPANSQPLGDVFQSMVAISDRLFLSVNNSNRISVIRKDNFQLLGTIPVSQPRYILPIDSATAFVSSLYSNKVTSFDPQTMQVTGTISLPYTNTEGMALFNGKAWICIWDTACHALYGIDITTKAVSSIPLDGAAPQEIVLDKYNNAWIIAGNVEDGVPATLTRIDLNSFAKKTFKFPTAEPIKPVFNATRDTLYFIEVNYKGTTSDNGIYRMSISDTALPTHAFVQAQTNQYFWALGIDPTTGNICIGDPKGFNQSGDVYIYSPAGAQLRVFQVGIGPGHFYFTP